jgi:hypothetical protein
VQVNAGDSAADLSVRLTEVYQELEVSFNLKELLYTVMHGIVRGRGVVAGEGGREALV